MTDSAGTLADSCEVRVRDEAWSKGKAELAQGSLTVIRQGGPPVHVELSLGACYCKDRTT